MEGLMMDYQLNVPAILRRADELFGDREIVSRLPDKSWHRYTYADFTSRAKRLAVALRGLGPRGRRPGRDADVEPPRAPRDVHRRAGRRLRHAHAEPPAPPDDNTYIATHAGDRVLVVDKVLWPLAEQFVDRVGFEHVIAVGAGETPDGAIDFEELLDRRGRGRFLVPRHRRARRRRDVLHERHDRPAEGRRLLPSGDRDPLADRGPGPRDQRGRHRAARRADVPRERLVLPVRLHALRREAGVPRPAPRPAEPPRGVRDGAGDDQRRRADDLDGHPAGARREPERVGISRRCGS